MENVIVIEQKTFEELMARFNRLAGMVDRFCRKGRSLAALKGKTI